MKLFAKASTERRLLKKATPKDFYMIDGFFHKQAALRVAGRPVGRRKRTSRDQ
ncbi:hypothetical protein [Komagataeibacter rhaeticus]|uniref:Uncharacterized protein n=1 Tax=Komagataeibacter rhaeticus TaxID=215221 RepID=A0A858JG13_9PROT|nr:hypothetical protein [Komagataeibacter rhaeticus]QIP34900.1 hypothetical protein GWK63_04845 [Komagataeibacter rhaeticus]QOC47433.1 hypothetical protein ICJ78_04855 [Komagataeibacter rhaeticus]